MLHIPHDAQSMCAECILPAVQPCSDDSTDALAEWMAGQLLHTTTRQQAVTHTSCSCPTLPAPTSSDPTYLDPVPPAPTYLAHTSHCPTSSAPASNAPTCPIPTYSASNSSHPTSLSPGTPTPSSLAPVFLLLFPLFLLQLLLPILLLPILLLPKLHLILSLRLLALLLAQAIPGADCGIALRDYPQHFTVAVTWCSVLTVNITAGKCLSVSTLHCHWPVLKVLTEVNCTDCVHVAQLAFVLHWLDSCFKHR